jgi:hypothetical protein
MDNRLYVDKNTLKLIKVISGIEEKKQAVVIKDAMEYWASQHGLGEIINKIKNDDTDTRRN